MPTTAIPTPMTPTIWERSAVMVAGPLPSLGASSALHQPMTAMTKPTIVRPIPHRDPSRSGLAPPPVTLSLATSASNWARRDDDIAPFASVSSSFMGRISSLGRRGGRLDPRGRVVGAKIRVGELACDARRRTGVQQTSVQHDPGSIGEPEDLVRELLDDEDRQAGGGDAA